METGEEEDRCEPEKERERGYGSTEVQDAKRKGMPEGNETGNGNERATRGGFRSLEIAVVGVARPLVVALSARRRARVSSERSRARGGGIVIIIIRDVN